MTPTLSYRLCDNQVHLLCLLACFTRTLVRASPLPQDLFDKRDDASKPSVPAAIWTPAVIIFVVFVALAALGCLGRIYLRHSRAAQIANATTNQTGTGVALTANQLAGTINGDAAGANTARRARRPRRPRRTPSQVSVTSLPEYMKEPGEEEVVIFSSQNVDPEGRSMPQPAATVMPDHPSDDEEGREDGNGRGAEEYAPMPASPNTMPLLQEQDGNGNAGDDNNNNDTSSADVLMRELTQPRSTSPRSGDTISLRRFDSNNTQASSIPLARAPPAYFEVIGDDERLRAYYPPSSSTTVFSASTSSTSAPLLGSSTLSSPEVAQTSTSRNQQSGFRTFFNRMSLSMPIGSGGTDHQHQRSHSSTSATSAPGPARPSFPFLTNRPKPPAPSHSANPSITSLTSPSTLSIHSISLPLTHTASRTQFAFPSSRTTGLPTATPEQLRIIASREAIGRFGVPYGPDAVAFARMERPPGFEEAVVSSPVAAAASVVQVEDGPSVAREPSSALSSSSTARPVDSASSRPGSDGTTSPHQSQTRPDPNASSTPAHNTDVTTTTTTSSSSTTTPVSEFGRIDRSPSTKLLSASLSPPTTTTNVRPESLSSVYTSRTYMTAAEVPPSPSPSSSSRLSVRLSVGLRSVDGLSSQAGWSGGGGAEEGPSNGRI